MPNDHVHPLFREILAPFAETPSRERLREAIGELCRPRPSHLVVVETPAGKPASFDDVPSCTSCHHPTCTGEESNLPCSEYVLPVESVEACICDPRGMLGDHRCWKCRKWEVTP